MGDWPAGTTHIKAPLPVYLPDRTIIGEATVSVDGSHISIEMKNGAPYAELIADNLVGLAIVYMSNEARDRISEGEATDDGQQRRAS